MIKASGVTGDGRPLLILGLSGENVTRLVADEPIFITPEQMAEMALPPMALAIVYGRTEEAIKAQLEEYFGARNPDGSKR